MEIGQHFPNTDTFHFVHEIHDAGMSLEAAMREFIKMWASWGGSPRSCSLATRPATPGTSATGDRTGSWPRPCCGPRTSRSATASRARQDRRQPARVERALFDTVRQVRRVKIHTRCERLLVDMREVPIDEGRQTGKDRRVADARGRYLPLRGTLHQPDPRARIKSSGRVIA